MVLATAFDEDGLADTAGAAGADAGADVGAGGGGRGGPVTIALCNHVRWERFAEYTRWMANTTAVMSTFNGFVSCRVIEPADQATGGAQGSGDGWGDGMYTIIYRFSTLAHMQAWVTSAEREACMLKLRPLIHTSTAAGADGAGGTGGAGAMHAAAGGARGAGEQAHRLPDSFSDLFVPQGQAAPARPPAKWKVAVLTTVSLFFVNWGLGRHMPRHYERWGLGNAEARMLATTALSTFVNTFCAAPFIQLLLGHWLRLPRPVAGRRQPWKALDEGVASVRGQAAVAAAWFVPCLIGYALDHP
eukprot:g5851.t1